jgi:PhnB protein
MKLTPYLTFPGTCEAAFSFYRDALQGEIVSLRHFDSTQMPVPEAYKKKVLHAVLRFGESRLMACDALPDKPLDLGNNITLSLEFEDLAAQQARFQALAEGGQITMPLQDTFWGARFGMFTDKFGIQWMMNCEQKK